VTRAEVKKQIDAGWLTMRTAMLLMGLDLDFAAFERRVEAGMLTVVNDGAGERLFRLHDVLALSNRNDLSSKQLLDKYWPVNKRKNPAPKQQQNGLLNDAEREEFDVGWFRLHRYVAKLIASPDEDFRFGELRLVHQLMAWAQRLNTFELVVTGEQIEKATGLDDEAWPKVRRSLERRNILAAERNGSLGWVLTFLNPLTRGPFESLTDCKLVMIPESSWSDLTE
jgi:hypothetical protein